MSRILSVNYLVLQDLFDKNIKSYFGAFHSTSCSSQDTKIGDVSNVIL